MTIRKKFTAEISNDDEVNKERQEEGWLKLSSSLLTTYDRFKLINFKSIGSSYLYMNWQIIKIEIKLNLRYSIFFVNNLHN